MRDRIFSARENTGYVPLFELLIALESATLAFALGLKLTKHIVFRYEPGTAFGWAAKAQYPKQQELFFFVGSFCLFALFFAAVRLLAIRFASSLASRRKAEPASMLLYAAAPGLPIFGLWHRMLDLDRPSLWAFGSALFAAGMLALVLHRCAERLPLFRVSTGPIETDRVPQRRTIALQVIGAVVVFVFTLSNAISYPLDLFHEGEKLAPLEELSQGKLPYRDFYLQRGFLTNVGIPWAGAKLFGESVVAVRAAERWVESLPYAVFFLLCAVVLRSGVAGALLAAVLVSPPHFWIGPRYIFFLFAILAGVLGTRHPFERRSPKNQLLLVLAGLFSGVALMFSVEGGLYAIASLGTYVFILDFARWRRKAERAMILPFGVGLLGFLSVPILLLLYLGGLWDAVRSILIQLFTQQEVWGLAYPSIFQFSSDAEIAQFYFPITVLLATFAWLLSRFVRGELYRDPGLILLFIAAFFQFRTALGRSDLGHVYDGSTLVWLLVLLMGEEGIRTFWQIRRSVRESIPFGAILVVSICAATDYALTVHQPGAKIQKFVREGPLIPLLSEPLVDRSAQDGLRIGGNYIPEEQRAHLSSIVRLIQHEVPAGESFLDLSNQGALYFLARRRAASRYHQAAYIATRAMESEVIRALEVEKPKLVILRMGTGFDCIDGVCANERTPELWRYIQSHYPVVEEFQGVSFARRVN